MERNQGSNLKIALVVTMSLLVPIVVARAESRPDARITKVGIQSWTAPSVRHGLADTEDDSIRRGVEKALSDLDARANANIQVLVKDCVVWLTGSVPTWRGNDSRVSATRKVKGVRSIVNSLRVDAPNVTTR